MVSRSTSAEELAAEGTKDVGWLTAQAEDALDAGADIIMIESEGITEDVGKEEIQPIEPLPALF